MIDLASLSAVLLMSAACPECTAAHSAQMNDIAAAPPRYEDEEDAGPPPVGDRPWSAPVYSTPFVARGYASVAWPKSAGWNHVAIVTGRSTVGEADADAIALCERESRLACERYLDHPDMRNSSHMGFYSLSSEGLHIVFGRSIEDLHARAMQASQENGVEYRNRAVVDLTVRAELTPAY